MGDEPEKRTPDQDGYGDDVHTFLSNVGCLVPVLVLVLAIVVCLA